MMRACLFDFDGTLVDTKADIVASLARAFERCGILFREFPAEIVMQLQLRDAIAALAPETTVDKQEKIIAAFTDIYDTGDYPNTTLMPTVTDLLDEMKARSIKPFIVTNKRLAPTLFLLDKFKLRHLFGDVYAPDMVFGKRKTKIELLNDIIDAYSINKEATFYVGDTEADVVAARAAGLPTIAVKNGYGDVSRFTVRPDHVVSRIIDLLSLLG